MQSILHLPSPDNFARFKPGFGQRFLITVDTEEEFDWKKPLSSDGHSLTHIPRIRKFQEFCENAGVCPIYLVDYPVATSRLAADVLGDALQRGAAEVGIQLHPWVNPPFDEKVSEENSFVGNLPKELERAKFQRLRNTIQENFGALPQIYRAGRYGIGNNSAQILKEASVAIDTSVRSHFDYSSEGGADYHRHPLHPYWIDDQHTLLEMPLTTVFWGVLRKQGPWLYPRLWRMPSMRGILAKAGLLERIPLTPEGITVDEAIRGIDIALDDGLPLLVFSFHSPSLHPGHTPYVRSEDELDGFYDWWRSVFAYLQQRGVAPTNVRGIMENVLTDD